MNKELSEWVSEILEAGMECRENSEVISTEDLLHEVDELNREWREKGVNMEQNEVFVGSLDATALYPSLDVQRCGQLFGQMIQESKLEFRGVDYKWAAIYIALNCKPWEITRWKMNHLVPSRRFKGGQRPKIAGATIPCVR